MFVSTRIPPTIHQLLFRGDVITLQNPHGLPPASISNPTDVAKVVKTEQITATEPEAPRAITAVKVKATLPCTIILSPPTAADPHLREYFSLFQWHTRCSLDFYFSRSLTNNELQTSLGRSVYRIFLLICAFPDTLFVWQEELMFEDISKPLKGKGKEKDVGKRRAYVRVVTSLGGASLNLELYCEKVEHLGFNCYNGLLNIRF